MDIDYDVRLMSSKIEMQNEIMKLRKELKILSEENLLLKKKIEETKLVGVT